MGWLFWWLFKVQTKLGIQTSNRINIYLLEHYWCLSIINKYNFRLFFNLVCSNLSTIFSLVLNTFLRENQRNSLENKYFAFLFNYLRLCVLSSFFIQATKAERTGLKNLKKNFFFIFLLRINYLPSILRCNENLKFFVRNVENRFVSDLTQLQYTN